MRCHRQRASPLSFPHGHLEALINDFLHVTATSKPAELRKQAGGWWLFPQRKNTGAFAAPGRGRLTCGLPCLPASLRYTCIHLNIHTICIFPPALPHIDWAVLAALERWGRPISRAVRDVLAGRDWLNRSDDRRWRSVYHTLVFSRQNHIMYSLCCHRLLSQHIRCSQREARHTERRTTRRRRGVCVYWTRRRKGGEEGGYGAARG
ncbi:hypothetical protein LZ32DRAFT_133980 [Colletotrichum eremochloae]|nr:hypothetical protein LZ32DRAFT_133980 [Colletotrichum eremochloae]